MSQSLARNHLHIIFSTKHRELLIHEPIQSELYNYVGAICNELECYPEMIGGYTDHIHILARLSKKIALMKFLEEVKSNSSKWMKTKASSLANFFWQSGYAAYSVSESDVERVKKYIEDQKEH